MVGLKGGKGLEYWQCSKEKLNIITTISNIFLSNKYICYSKVHLHILMVLIVHDCLESVS